ncbi:hypothetical protein C0989_002212 [Termitomyces sp. Mn162]|nr:hypothetical protein C0989_002212 [Termitomyces sp. Mn162]
MRTCSNELVATILSFSPRLSQVSPILFLIFIVITLGTTAFLFLTRRRTQSSVSLTLTPAPPSPIPSHMSLRYTNSLVEKPPPAFLRSQSELDLSPHPRSFQQHIPPPSGRLDLFCLLFIQLSYTVATAFCIPVAFRSSSTASPPVVSLVATSSNHVSISTYIFQALDVVLKIFALLAVFGAYYHCSGCPTHRRKGKQSTYPPTRTETFPRRPNTRILSPPTSPPTTGLQSLIQPSFPITTSTSIKLGFFKTKHQRAGPSASSSFFSPHPKRMPLVPSSNLDLRPGLCKSVPYEFDLEPISPCPSSSSTCVTFEPTFSATKERSSVDDPLSSLRPSCNSVLVRVATPMPVLCRERAWSWAHSTPMPKGSQDTRDDVFDGEDCTDLKDPFAPGPVQPPVAPSAYRRWVDSVEGSSSEARLRSEHEAHPQTRMSTWGHIPLHKPRQCRTAPSLRVDTTVCAST